MAEIIDVLMPKYSACPYYEINTTAASHKVPLSNVTPACMYISDVSSLIGKFQSRDNIRLISAGFYIPETFSLADTIKVDASLAGNELALQVHKSDLSLSGAMPGLGPRGVVGIPFANYELSLDIFSSMVSVSLLPDNCFYLYCGVFANDLSMVGVPSVFDTTPKTKIHVIPFIKIMHTLPIIA